MTELTPRRRNRVAAHTTRDKKEIHTPSEVLAAHRQDAAEFGNQADRVVQEARDRANIMERKPLAATPERVQEAFTFAKSRNFEREAVTDERDILRDALRRGTGHLTYSEVRGHFEQRVTSGEFQIAPGQKHETGRQFTTREALAEELSTIKQMQQGQQAAEPIMRQDDAAAHDRSREFLNPAQQRAIEEVLTSQDRIHGLQGLAGSGKTSALSRYSRGCVSKRLRGRGLCAHQPRSRPTSRCGHSSRHLARFPCALRRRAERGRPERTASLHARRIQSRQHPPDAILPRKDRPAGPRIADRRHAATPGSRRGKAVRADAGSWNADIPA